MKNLGGLRKFSIALLGVALVFVCSSCGGVDARDDQIRSWIATRVSNNDDLLQKLRQAGVLSDTQYEALSNTMSSNSQTIIESLTAGAGTLFDKISGAVTSMSGGKQRFDNKAVCWVSPAFTEGGKHDKQDACGAGLYVTDYSGDVVPYDLLASSNSGAEELAKSINYPVYVLDPKKAASLESSGGLEGLQSSIEKARDSGDYSGVSNYFAYSGYNIFDGTSGNLFSATKPAAGSSLDGTAYNKLGFDLYIPTDESFRQAHTKRAVTTVNGDGSTTTKYVVDCEEIANHKQKNYAFAVRLIELNPDVVTQITGAGSGDLRFVIVPSDNEPYALLMEYPVDIISSIVANDENGSFNVETTTSDLRYNLLSGGVTYHDGKKADDGSIKSASTIAWPVEQEVLNASSFRITNKCGEQGELSSTFGFYEGTGTKRVEAPHMMLAHYMEAVYLPGTSSEGDVAVLGRRIKITKTSGQLNSEIGVYDNFEMKTDVVSDEKHTIRAADLCDAEGLLDGHVNNLSMAAREARSDTPENVEDLAVNEVASIRPVCAFFNSDTLAGRDINTVNKSDSMKLSAIGSVTLVSPPPMYALTVCTGPFTSGLYSSWIKNSSGLSWWTDWLGSAGFSYTINTEALESNLMQNYASELRDDGVIILDLDTIDHIRQDYVEDQRADSIGTFRTLFAIVGMLVTAYAFILLSAWALDVNIIGGPKVLPKVTGNKFMAVMHTEDEKACSGYSGELKPLGFTSILWRAIKLIALGAVISMVDIMMLIALLMKAFGGLAELIGGLFSGLL